MLTKKPPQAPHKYIDLALEDCVLPVYLSKRLHTILQQQTMPNMLFKHGLWETKTIIANALAKKLGAQLISLEFNKEPRIKNIKKGERTLTILKWLLKKFAAQGERKLFIIEDLQYFPKNKYAELMAIIETEKFHRFIFYQSDQLQIAEFVPYFPQISFDFKINHSADEEQAFWQQCRQLSNKFNPSLRIEDINALIRNTYYFWLSLFDRDTLKLLRKEIESVQLNPA